jgi:hypothetical protein
MITSSAAISNNESKVITLELFAMNTSFPLLFVSHGAPMFAIEPGPAGQRLAEFGRELMPSSSSPYIE